MLITALALVCGLAGGVAAQRDRLGFGEQLGVQIQRAATGVTRHESGPQETLETREQMTLHKQEGR
jgi:hypothetical protein